MSKLASDHLLTVYLGKWIEHFLSLSEIVRKFLTFFA